MEASKHTTTTEVAGSGKRRIGAEQRAAWIKQNLGDGWTEEEPGIYSFEEAAPHPEETAPPARKNRPGKTAPHASSH